MTMIWFEFFKYDDRLFISGKENKQLGEAIVSIQQQQNTFLLSGQ